MAIPKAIHLDGPSYDGRNWPLYRPALDTYEGGTQMGLCACPHALIYAIMSANYAAPTIAAPS